MMMMTMTMTMTMMMNIISVYIIVKIQKQCICTADLADVAAKHDVNLHSFADDTQLYVHCRRCDTSTAVDRLKECITEVGQWMSANRLKLKAHKTELLWAESKHGLAYTSAAANRHYG